MMNAQLPWSEDKLKRLQEKLVGRWADDIWILTFTQPKPNRRYLKFSLTSQPLKVEVKYTLWSKFDSGQWKLNRDHHNLCKDMTHIIRWLNHFSPPLQSLMEKPLEQLVLSLRSYLVERNLLRRRGKKVLSATQEYVEYFGEDPRILLFIQIYKIVCDAYDDRPDTEKDIWDMVKMGLAVNLAIGHRMLNFTCISQPWLRSVAKEFTKFNMNVHSPGDCFLKLQDIRIFSQFLEKHYPSAQISDIDGSMIAKYISFLRESGVSDHTRRRALGGLRTVLETCAYQLQIVGVTKEQIIFNDDLPKEKERLSREIPEEVLEQLRKHLDALDTSTLRMVVILLECGMRISELCTLPLDCLVCDDKQHWFLRSYQMKPKQEHIIPLVDTTVIKIIQAQQQASRERWGQACPYLFPSIKSHTLPFKEVTFANKLNKWAVKKDIRDSAGKLYRFQSHQFRHTVAMELINNDVPLDVISRLLGHHSLKMTQIYAKKREGKKREELERISRKRKTVNYQGKIVTGDARANDPDIQLVRKGIRGQTLPIGGCGRLIVRGDCVHANKCLTCPSWLTSTEDLPRLKIIQSKAFRLRQRANEVGNLVVLENQDRIIPLLAVRINSLEDANMDTSLPIDEFLGQLRADLAAAEEGQDETREAGALLAGKFLERSITALKAQITELEASLE